MTVRAPQTAKAFRRPPAATRAHGRLPIPCVLTTFDDLAVSQRAPFSKTITAADLSPFAAGTGDVNLVQVRAGGTQECPLF